MLPRICQCFYRDQLRFDQPLQPLAFFAAAVESAVLYYSTLDMEVPTYSKIYKDASLYSLKSVGMSIDKSLILFVVLAD